MSDTVKPELLFDDYKVKVDYLKAHYDRLWTRFHFFLTVELGIFGFLGYVTFDKQRPGAQTLAIIVGAVVSLLWYIVGAQDRALVKAYRQRASDAATRFATEAGIPGFDLDHAAAEIDADRGFLSWYHPKILRVTEIPALCGVLLTVLWTGLLFSWKWLTSWM